MADNKENNKWSRPPQPPPSSNPSYLALWCREEGTLWEQGFCCVSFFYHGALSLQVIHTGRNKTLLDSVIFMAFFLSSALTRSERRQMFWKVPRRRAYLSTYLQVQPWNRSVGHRKVGHMKLLMECFWLENESLRIRNDQSDQRWRTSRANETSYDRHTNDLKPGLVCIWLVEEVALFF